MSIEKMPWEPPGRNHLTGYGGQEKLGHSDYLGVNMSDDTRWVQRFSNYRKALTLLEAADLIQMPSHIETEGMIKRFEYTFELAWKTLQDYLSEMGFKDFAGPRDTLKLAFANGVITDGQVWMDMIQARNLSSHTYDLKTAKKLEADIRNLFLARFIELRSYLANKL